MCFVKIVTVNCFVKVVAVNCVFRENWYNLLYVSWKSSQLICVSWKLSQWIVCLVKSCHSLLGASWKLSPWIVSWKSLQWIVFFFRENRRSELCVLVKTVAVKYVFVRIVAVNCVFRENCSSEMCISWKSWHWKPCLNSGRKFISLLYHVHRRTWLKFRTSDVHVMLFRIGDFRENRPRECFYLVLV